MENIIKIHNWAIVGLEKDPYTPPELIGIALSGNAINHPAGFDYSHRIRTSQIIKVKKRIVYTKNGSIYRLGTISRKYRQWIRKNYKNWDYRNPIKTKEN